MDIVKRIATWARGVFGVGAGREDEGGDDPRPMAEVAAPPPRFPPLPPALARVEATLDDGDEDRAARRRARLADAMTRDSAAGYVTRGGRA